MVKAARSKARRGPNARFTGSEIAEMEKLLAQGKNIVFEESFYQKLTEKFNLSSGRSGNRVIQAKQIEKWFHDRQKNDEDEVNLSPKKERIDNSDASLSNSAPESSTDIPKDSGDKVPGLLELEFEAKSCRDGAWYDVATFLSHRVLTSGEAEVRVRFQGFGAEDDEWVNVKKAIRERSIPLEPSECQRIEVGDLVLCFRESRDQAIYFDAHILEIERKLHDIRGCRCVFLVRYDHDQTEESVPLRRLCRRPMH